MKVLWATGFDKKYYNWIFSKVQHTWKLLPNDLRFYTDDFIPALVDDPRAVPSGIDFSKCPPNLTRKESKFWKKALCIIAAVRAAHAQQYDYCIWLDADITVTGAPDLTSLLPDADQILSVNHKIVPSGPGQRIDLGLDTGFVAVNLRHPQLLEWINHYENIWVTDEMNSMTRKYDTYVLDRIINKYSYPWKNLWHGVNTHGKHYCGFEDSDLEQYFFHHWGSKQKYNIKEPV